MQEKYLFFDMDGTLISPATHHILPSSIEGIKQAQERGARVFLCTGRGYGMAQEYKDELDVPGIIFSNGGGIAYDGKILETRDIHPRIVKEMVSRVESLGGGYQILGLEYCWQNEKEHLRFAKRFPNQYKDLTVEQVFERKAMRSIEDYDDGPIQKMDFNFDSELTADWFFAKIPASLNVVMSGGYYANLGRRGGELTCEGVSKGQAIKRVLDMFGANVFDAYGFGDSMNDIEMLKTCGHSIAMGNAIEDVKKCADYITNDADHDGIYHALKHFELID